MPLTKTGSKVLAKMEQEYGVKKGKSVFYAMAHSKGKKWHKSPDSYDPDSVESAQPRRLHYSSSPENMHPGETAQMAGASRGSIQQLDGTDNRRANYKTKSASVPEPSAGGTKFGDVNSYDDTKDF